MDFINGAWLLVMIVLSLAIFFIWIKEHTSKFIMFILFIYIALEFISELNGQAALNPLLVFLAIFVFIFLYIKGIKSEE